MELEIALLEYKKKVEKELEMYFQNKTAEYDKISAFSGKFIRNIAEYSLRGGKRVRPALFYYAYKMFGGNKEAEIVKLSIFMELIQSYLLIHDDIFDYSNTRRGGPTFHKMYEKISVETGWGNPAHFGATMGILGGDIASQLAYELITNSNFLHERKSRVLHVVTTLTTDVLIGQIEDFILSYQSTYTEKDIKKIHSYKTVTYTFDMPLLAGAILAGKSETEKDVIALREYAHAAGMAFQIRDDILGVFGNESKTGKPSISDIKEGKKTWLVLKAEEKANKEQLSIIKDLLGKKNLIMKEANEFRNVLVETGSLEYSKKKCLEYVRKAQRALKKIGIRDENWEFLYALADYLVVREV